MYIQSGFQSKELSLGSPGEKALDPCPRTLALPLCPLQVLVHRRWNLNLHLFVRLVRRQSLALDCDHLIRILILGASLRK